MKKIVYSRQDGGVSIVIPVPKVKLEKQLGAMTDAEYEAHVIQRSIPEGLAYRHIEDADIPATREFRNAWEDSQPGTQIDICCAKARDIMLERLRVERDALLVVEDKNFMKALEKGEDTSAIATKKQELRDATETLKALQVEGVYNDEALLEQIRTLGVIPNQA